MKLDTSTILVLAPHCDDEIHCMGTLIDAMDAGSDVHIHAFSGCEESVPDGFPKERVRHEFEDAMAELSLPRSHWSAGSMRVRRFDEVRQQILEVMVSLRSQIEPTIVFCPSSTDTHQDHHVIYEEAVRAFRNVHALLGWEAPHNQSKAITNVHMGISQNALDGKIAHWRNYDSQSFRGYFNEEFLHALAVVRGAQMRNRKSKFAEAFEMIGVTVTT